MASIHNQTNRCRQFTRTMIYILRYRDIPAPAAQDATRRTIMRTALALALGLLATPALAATPTDAQIIAEICPACTSIVLAGNADFQATGGRNFIDFHPQATGSAL